MKRKSEQKMTFDKLGRTPVLKDLVAKAELHRQAEGEVLAALPSELVEKLNAATAALKETLGPSFDYYDSVANDRTV